ncbi:MAG: hypothetical protein CND86_02685 [Bacteroidetes bacterium MED-G21]|nr:MAG: hypothetical protein CND86_02685 [Bacteroidetes bacterium MED-G21]
MWVNFDELPLQSRVWVFQSNRIMSPDEQSSIDNAVKQFVQKWSTHGLQMLASHVLFHNCFVIIAADEQRQAASGCSIDSFTALFKAFGTQYNLSFFDRFSIAHKLGDEVLISNLDDFKQLINDGRITPDTLVFNNLIEQRQDLSTKWELPLKESWQKRYL